MSKLDANNTLDSNEKRLGDAEVNEKLIKACIKIEQYKEEIFSILDSLDSNLSVVKNISYIIEKNRYLSHNEIMMLYYSITNMEDKKKLLNFLIAGSNFFTEDDIAKLSDFVNKIHFSNFSLKDFITLYENFVLNEINANYNVER